MHHARRHQGRGAVWPPKRKEKKDMGGAKEGKGRNEEK